MKALELNKRRSFRILLLAEIVLLLAGMPGLFGKTKVYEYGFENMVVNFGNWDEATGSFVVQDGSGQQGDMVDFVNISLPRGVYTVSLRYQTDTFMKNGCYVSKGTASHKALLTNFVHCYPEWTSTGFDMWLLEDVGAMNIHASYGGEGYFSVAGLTVRETNALNRIWIFCAVVGGLFVNICYLYAAWDRKFGISAQDKTVHFILALAILFASMPLMVDYVANSGDLVYHLMRVEGIKDSILDGQFPNRIAPKWQQGYGYASAIFYGETALYVMAFFRLIGFTVLTSYRMFFFLLNAVTALVSYYCFRKIFQEKYIGLLCAVLYLLSVYRIFKTYATGGFGESVALVFLPILAYGFYRVFSEDTDSEEYGRGVIPLTVGFGGLLQTHLLSGELAGLFTIFLCLIMVKKVFRKKTFVVLAKAAVYSCLFSAWFLVPFLDYMLTGDFVIHNVSARTIQYRGLLPAHLFFAFPINGNTVFTHLDGMYNSAPTNPGIAFTVVLILWLGLRFFGQTGVLKREELALGRIAALFAALSMWMSLSAFPWDRIQSIGGVAATLVSSLQFPSRMLSVATLMLTLLVGVTAKCVAGNYGQHGEKAYIGGMAVMLLMSNIWLLTYMTCHESGFYLYNEESMGSGYISGAEYLPYGADASQFIPRPPKMYGGVGLEGYEKKGLTVDVRCVSTGAEPGGMDLPLLYYKGYRAWDKETGQEFNVCAGENFSVRVELPAGYSGTVRTAFVSPFYWRMAEMVSLASFAMWAGLSIWRRKRNGFDGMKGHGG